MSKVKLFIDNFLVYGVGGVISKIIPLIMVPVITRLMPNSDYFGISDLSNTVVQFGSAIAVMGMYDAMYRMFFEKEEIEYKRKVCSTAFLFTVCVSVIVFFIMLVARGTIAEYFFGDRNYTYVVYLSAIATLVGATNSIISAPTRMQNRRKVFLITNTVSPMLSYSISIPLLLAGHYVIALPLAAVISGSAMELSFGIMNRKWFSPHLFDRKILRQLLAISVPMLPNFLIYWLFNSCDKVMITNIIGVGAAGIYSVASKLGHASQLIYTAFAGGWQFFAFSTMREADQVKSNSCVFEYLGVLSFMVTCFICAWSYPLFRILFTDQYLPGFISAPYLFLAPLLLMLFQVACNQFLVIKKTWPNIFVLSLGAVLNIVLNRILIPVLGIEGASIATLMGYVISDISCVLVLCRMKLMVVSGKFLASVLIMAVFMTSWRLFYPNNMLLGTIAAVVAAALFVFLYRQDIRRLKGAIKDQGS